LDFIGTHLCLVFPEAHDAHGSMTPSINIHSKAFAVLRVFLTSTCPNLACACACASVSTVCLQVAIEFETSKCHFNTIAYTVS
jgi:hypothetical protein